VTNLMNNLNNLTAGHGPYCVWVPVREGDRAHLEMRWIDPNAEIPELSEARALGGVEKAETEDEPWPATSMPGGSFPAQGIRRR
jgi:hypothetical protein